MTDPTLSRVAQAAREQAEDIRKDNRIEADDTRFAVNLGIADALDDLAERLVAEPQWTRTPAAAPLKKATEPVAFSTREVQALIKEATELAFSNGFEYARNHSAQDARVMVIFNDADDIAPTLHIEPILREQES